MTAVVEVSASGAIMVKATGATDVVVEVQGWFTGETFKNRFRAVSPTRLLDTRVPQGACPAAAVECSRVGAGQARTVSVVGQAGLPTAEVKSVVANVIAVGASGPGHLEVYAEGATDTDDARVHFQDGSPIGATVIIPVNAYNGAITVEAVGADVDVVIDVQGYFGGTHDTTTYTYDGSGLRRAKQSPDGNIEFSWDQSGGLPLLLSQHDGATERYWVYGPGGVPIEELGGLPMFYHHDQLGSIRSVSAYNGYEVASFTYDAYGNLTHATGTYTTPFGYAGQYTDTETGLQYLRARYYDPTTGNFLTRDPIETITREAYGYVYGNPLNAADPTGLRCWTGVKGSRG